MSSMQPFVVSGRTARAGGARQRFDVPRGIDGVEPLERIDEVGLVDRIPGCLGEGNEGVERRCRRSATVPREARR